MGLEDGDMLSLGNPQRYIFNKSGYIFYAHMHGEIVGIALILRKTHTLFELNRMAVYGTAQGKGIGKLLLEHCLDFARQKGVKKLILYSNI